MDRPLPHQALPQAPHDARTLVIRDNRIPSRELLDGRGPLEIEHQGRRYQLRETRNGKLILTC
ncbi:hemin uptake protein HemP [Halomonas pacifica]|uniref:Hemin uptake protein HemP n=1 Tax=Bisbaumannia pacifica TaxID=77098 RepID=A0A510XBK4_9GAMM|nr:hemin uptake protein HemP [Halomonas pacifica]MBH8579981.1 hemin uptake protein HemP [Halomonas pacifica]MDC8803581.1 hemin uptake protein HemP [Halomonas pacifica]GEK47925.1 hypothetical protein HPA02_22080 [Halomonas pacifica]